MNRMEWIGLVLVSSVWSCFGGWLVAQLGLATMISTTSGNKNNNVDGWREFTLERVISLASPITALGSI